MKRSSYTLYMSVRFQYAMRRSVMRSNNKDIVKAVAANLTDVRKHLNFSQAKMASYVGVNPSSYSKNENAQCLPSMSSLKRLSNSLNVSMDWLLFNRGSMFITKKKASSPIEDPLKKYTAAIPKLIEMLDHMLEDDLLCTNMMYHYQKAKKTKE